MLIDIFKRLPDSGNATLLGIEKDGGAFPGSEKGSRVVREEVLPQLGKLEEDEDVDVRFFASVARRGWEGDGNAMET